MLVVLRKEISSVYEEYLISKQLNVLRCQCLCNTKLYNKKIESRSFRIAVSKLGCPSLLMQYKYIIESQILYKVFIDKVFD